MPVPQMFWLAALQRHPFCILKHCLMRSSSDLAVHRILSAEAISRYSFQKSWKWDRHRRFTQKSIRTILVFTLLFLICYWSRSELTDRETKNPLRTDAFGFHWFPWIPFGSHVQFPKNPFLWEPLTIELADLKCILVLFALPRRSWKSKQQVFYQLRAYVGASSRIS